MVFLYQYSSLAVTNEYETIINGIKAKVRASSELSSPKTSGKYSVVNAFDGDISTAWVEGSLGAGEGEWIEVTFESMVFMEKLRVSNGYRKSENLFKENGRIQTFDLSLDEKISPLFTSILIGADTTLQINKCIRTFRITVTQAVKGLKYYDMCISEINTVIKPVDNVTTVNNVSVFVDSFLTYQVKKSGITVISNNKNNKGALLFDSTIRSFAELKDAKLNLLNIPGLENFKIFEITVQYEFDRDVFMHVFNDKESSALFFHQRSMSSDGSTDYHLKIPVQYSGEGLIMEFSGTCTYPECNDFGKQMKFKYKNGKFIIR